MGDYSKTWDRTAADDALDYAMGASLLATAITAIALINNGHPAAATIIGLSIIGGIWTFTIVPHLVAYWFNTDIDNLLGIRRTTQLQLTEETDTDA